MYKKLVQCNNLKQSFLAFNFIQASTQQEISNLNIKKDASEDSNPLMMQPPTVISKSKYQSTNDVGIRKLIPVTQSQFNKALSKFNTSKTINSNSNRVVPMIKAINTNTIKKVSDIKIATKVPVLKITINKKYNRPMSNLDKSKHVSNVTNNIDVYKTTKFYTNNKLKTNLKNCVQNIAASSKPVIINLVPVVFEKSIKCEDTTMETKNTCTTSKIAYTRKGDLSRDNSRNQTSAERIRYLYTKAQRDCDVLRIRLKALRERHKQEKEEIKKLQTHLDNHYKNVIKESQNEIATGHLKRKKLFVSLDDPEEKDEYEKLLREVRKIKQDILNPKYPVTTSNKKLEQIIIFNHNKNEEISTEIYNNGIETNKELYKKSHSEVESGDIELTSSEKDLEPLFKDT